MKTVAVIRGARVPPAQQGGEQAGRSAAPQAQRSLGLNVEWLVAARGEQSALAPLQVQRVWARVPRSAWAAAQLTAWAEVLRALAQAQHSALAQAQHSALVQAPRPAAGPVRGGWFAAACSPGWSGRAPGRLWRLCWCRNHRNPSARPAAPSAHRGRGRHPWRPGCRLPADAVRPRPDAAGWSRARVAGRLRPAAAGLLRPDVAGFRAAAAARFPADAAFRLGATAAARLEPAA
jgi:hypothetical protein